MNQHPDGLSIIDRPIQLAELIESDLLHELCAAYADTHHLGIKVFDQDQSPLVEVNPHDRLAAWIFRFPKARRTYTRFVMDLKRTDLEIGDQHVAQDPVAGARFLMLPLVYEFEVLGKLVVGPYVLPNQEVPDLDLSEPGMERVQFEALWLKLPTMTDHEAYARVRLLITSFEAMFHSGYRALLTSNMHLESITDAYNALQRSNDELAARNVSLSEHNTRLKELDELKSNFLATVSHELRTPLTAVIGYSEMLLTGLAGALNDEQSEFVGTIKERGMRLLEMISGLLDVARIERGGHHLVFEKVSAAVLVEDALTNIRPQSITAGHTIVVDIAPDLPTLRVDATKICQVLINLLSNAVKFSLPHGTIHVRAAHDTLYERAGVRFEIQDTGIGLNEAQCERIFDAFYQADGSSTRAYGGTGLGLTIARRFIEIHGGEVLVDSTYGNGSTFTVRLPARPATEEIS